MFIWYTWSNIALWLFNFAVVKVYNLEIYMPRISMVKHSISDYLISQL
jgi:hypothetical protein